MPPVVRRVLAFPVAYAMITAIAGLHTGMGNTPALLGCES